jgi:hypothetical protein
MAYLCHATWKSRPRGEPADWQCCHRGLEARPVIEETLAEFWDWVQENCQFTPIVPTGSSGILILHCRELIRCPKCRNEIESDIGLFHNCPNERDIEPRKRRKGGRR